MTQFFRQRSPWNPAICVLEALILLCPQFLTRPVNGQERQPSDYSKVIQELRSVIEYEIQQKQLPAFSISLIDDQSTVWAEGFGFQDATGQERATANTVYRVGSVSKLFTDIGVMQLVEEGKLELDAPVQRYLPNFRPKAASAKSNSGAISLRQLMSHRSGLVRETPVGNYFDPSEPTLQATVASLNATSLVYEPNTRTKYSNAAVAVVGAILESQLQETHPDRIRRTIFEPLDMNASSFVVTDAIAPQLATGWMHTYDGRRFEAPMFLLGTGPAGNLYSSVVDLAKFVHCLFREGKTKTGRIASAETLKLMMTPITDADGKSQGFGLGFHVQNLDGHVKVGHGGAIYGFSTQLEVLPERRLGAVVATSLDGANGVLQRIADHALRLMIAVQDGQPLPKYRRTQAVPAERGDELVGDYRDATGSQYARIMKLNEQVYLERGTYRHTLRSAIDSGDIIVDDSIAFGTPVHLDDKGGLHIGQLAFVRQPDVPPADIPAKWKGLLGEYGWDHNTLYILEDHGQLYALIEWFYYYPLREVSENRFEFPDYGLYHGEGLNFTRGSDGVATEVVAAEVKFERREVGTKDGETFKIEPLRPIDELRKLALAATPPTESGNFRDSELVELVALDPTIKLDIRYATTNNFTGAVFYKQPRAFMQRPAAEAVVRVHQRLKSAGLGLLIHDAYRPWHVTKMFWDATPNEMKTFVANPANGSRHNRGCAVDLTLYDLSTEEPIQMVAGYDEFSTRSFPLYTGGTSRQRWYRHLLRQSMEEEGFAIYEFEWWHFDYQDWRVYRIGNATFEELSK